MQRTLHRVQPVLPVVAVRFLDVLEEDAAAALVLQLHQLLRVLPLLVRLVKEVFGKVLQSHIVAVKVVRHGQVDVGRVQLQVDLAVDGGLRVLVVVLAHLRGGRGGHGGGGEAAARRWSGGGGPGRSGSGRCEAEAEAEAEEEEEEEAAVAAAAADVAATERHLNIRRPPSARPGPTPEPTPSSAAPRPPGRPCAPSH